MIVVLVALMSMIYTDGHRDTYVFTQPVFTSIELCDLYSQQYQSSLLDHLKNKFPNDITQSIYCIEQNRLNDFYEYLEKSNKDQSV